MLTRQQNVYLAQIANNPSLFPQLSNNATSPDSQKLNNGVLTFHQSPKKFEHLPDI